MTALHFASDRGFLDIARFLVANGAEVNAATADGLTALDFATLCDHDDVAAYLRSVGAVEGVDGAP